MDIEQVPEYSREIATWRLRVAREQACPQCQGANIAVVVFGRSHLNSEAVLDDLFGIGNWVDGGKDSEGHPLFHCRDCSHRFGMEKDAFGIFGSPDLSI